MKSFFWSEYILYRILRSSRKAFQKIIGLSFLTPDHDLCISSKCYNNLLCFFDPGKCNGDNYSIICDTKNVLTREKHIFHFWQKVTWMKLKFKSKFLRFLTSLPTSKLSGETKNGPKLFEKSAFEIWDIVLSNARWIKGIRQLFAEIYSRM